MALTLRSVLDELGTLYNPPKTFLEYRTPLDLLIATILSAQCTDARVNIVTKEILYPKYHRPEDYVNVSQLELEEDIHSCGTYRVKAANIQKTCKMIIENFGGEVPRTMEELTTLAGVGRKTASVVLSAAFDIQAGIAVDTHVQRLAQRLGLSKHDDPVKIELDLQKGAPREEWRRVTTLLISHGRAVCTARNRKCGACVFKHECPSSLVEGKTDKAKPKKGGLGKRSAHKR